MVNQHSVIVWIRAGTRVPPVETEEIPERSKGAEVPALVAAWRKGIIEMLNKLKMAGAVIGLVLMFLTNIMGFIVYVGSIILAFILKGFVIALLVAIPGLGQLLFFGIMWKTAGFWNFYTIAVLATLGLKGVSHFLMYSAPDTEKADGITMKNVTPEEETTVDMAEPIAADSK